MAVKTDLGNRPLSFNPEYKPSATIYPSLHEEAPVFSISYPTINYERGSFDERTWNEYKTRITPDTPVFNPAYYRQNQDPSIAYQFPATAGGPIFGSGDLKILQQFLSLSLQGFDPWMIQETHPIHNELLKLCRRLLDNCKDLSLENKISYLNNAIAEIVLGSTDSNLSDSLTTYTARLPKYELLEIALRNHLYQGLLQQEENEIEKFHSFSKKIPNNLDQREIALHQFITKNNFYFSPNNDMYSILLKDLLSPYLTYCTVNASSELPLESALQKNEDLISKQLRALELTKPSQGSATFESILRYEITRKVITKIASQYRKEFQEKGTIDRDKLLLDISKLLNFSTKQGNFISNLNIGIQIIAEIFELSMTDCPFVSVRAKIIQEKNQQLTTLVVPEKSNSNFFRWIPSLSFTSSKKSSENRQLQLEALAGRKLETVDWVEKDWYTLTKPTLSTFASIDPSNLQPSAPPLEPDIVSDLNDQDFILVPTEPVQITNPGKTATLIPNENIQPTAVFEPSTPKTAILTPDQPIPAPKFNAKDRSIPVISYIDIAFNELLNRGNDREKWGSLPPIIQKDALLHVHYHPSTKGKAEDLTRAIFKNDGWSIHQQVMTLSKRHFQAPSTGLNEEFITKGQELIDFYYSDEIVGQFHNFIRRFRELPKESRFYQYVYEMAKAANVHIEPWDHHFAEYNWDQPGILPLSIQALERCLHTAP